jgi:hypothetical protein
MSRLTFVSKREIFRPHAVTYAQKGPTNFPAWIPFRLLSLRFFPISASWAFHSSDALNAILGARCLSGVCGVRLVPCRRIRCRSTRRRRKPGERISGSMRCVLQELPQDPVTVDRATGAACSVVARCVWSSATKKRKRPVGFSLTTGPSRGSPRACASDSSTDPIQSSALLRKPKFHPSVG